MTNFKNEFSVTSKLGASEFKDDSARIQMATLELAALYHENSLSTKAIDILECLINSRIQPSAVIYLALGDLYVNEGSDTSAKSCYTKAVEIALATEDRQVLVAAKAGTANIQAIVGASEANRLAQDALAEFEALENIHKWEQIKERVNSLISKEQKLPVLLLSLACGDCNAFGNPGRYIRSGGQWLCTGC